MAVPASSRQYRCPRGLEVQTLLFPRDTSWSSTRARAWARRHGFSSSKVDTTSQYFRVRNRNPNAFVRGSFRTIVLSEKDDVNAVVGCPLPGRESDRTRSANGRRSRRSRRDAIEGSILQVYDVGTGKTVTSGYRTREHAGRVASYLNEKAGREQFGVRPYDPNRRSSTSARDPDEVRVGDVYDEFGHEWRVTKIRGREAWVEREDRDAFGKNVPEHRIFNISAFRSMRKIRSGTGRTAKRDMRTSRRDSGGYRFEALYEGDDRWRSGGGETFPSMSAALTHAERVIRSGRFDGERARIVAPNGKTVWMHYPTRTRRGSSSRDTRASRLVRDLRDKGYDAFVVHDPHRTSRGRARRRDVSRYDLSTAGREWMRAYRAEGTTPEVRRAFDRLGRFDQAAIRFLLTEDNGPSLRDTRRGRRSRRSRDPVYHTTIDVKDPENNETVLTADVESWTSERDVLSTRKRENLRSSQFALPERRALPIHNAAHARNASARLEQMRKRRTVSRAEYARARRAIDRAERRFGVDTSRPLGR